MAPEALLQAKGSHLPTVSTGVFTLLQGSSYFSLAVSLVSNCIAVAWRMSKAPHLAGVQGGEMSEEGYQNVTPGSILRSTRIEGK
jgi:hypothetical protein